MSIGFSSRAPAPALSAVKSWFGRALAMTMGMSNKLFGKDFSRHLVCFVVEPRRYSGNQQAAVRVRWFLGGFVGWPVGYEIDSGNCETDFRRARSDGSPGGILWQRASTPLGQRSRH